MNQIIIKTKERHLTWYDHVVGGLPKFGINFTKRKMRDVKQTGELFNL